MSYKLVRTGAASTPVRNDLTTPTAIRISGNGLRGFHRSQRTTNNSSVSYYDYEGQINAEDWNGTAWSRVTGIGGDTGGGEIYSEGENEFQISKNGAAVGWDFKYNSPNTIPYNGIHISGYRIIYSFVAANEADPKYEAGTEITTSQNKNPLNAYEYKPRKIRFSDDASRYFVLYQSGNNLIEGSDGSSLFFPVNGIYGNNLQYFEISGDGNHIFVFIGGSLKLFSWSSSSWQFANEFITTGAAAVNYDGTVVVIRDSLVTRVYKKTGSTWAQLGSDLPSGNPWPWVNSTGTLVATGSAVYEWDGSAWVYKWQSIGALSDDATVAVAAAGAGSIYRYELRDVAPVYMGSLNLATSIYAGATEGKSLYAGNTLLWQKT